MTETETETTAPAGAPDAAPRDPDNVVDVPSEWQRAVEAFNVAAGELGDKPSQAKVRALVDAGQAAIEAGQAYLDELATSTVEDTTADPGPQDGGDVAEPQAPAPAGDVAAPDLAGDVDDELVDEIAALSPEHRDKLRTALAAGEARATTAQAEPVYDADGVKFAL